jgi:hypothetical protein
MSTKRRNSQFHVGDRVRFTLGRSKVIGVIVEDRGPFGVGGRQIFRVEIPQDPLDPMIWALREDEMEAVEPGTEPEPTLEKERIIEYLKYGGLPSILRSNMRRGKYHPRVWLCLDNLGNVTHTFYQERGIVGDQIPPRGALRGQKVFAPKLEDVISFLDSFGLNRREAEEVIAEFGTASR